MLQLAETKNKLVTYAMHNNYKGLYNKLTTILNPEQIALFAKPDIYSDTTLWYSAIAGNYTISDITDFTLLKDEQKDIVADQIEALKEEIAIKLSTNNEFKSNYTDFFIVPSENDIKVISADNKLIPILVQWGCKSNEATSKIDPVTFVIQRPRITSAKVVIQVNYTDGVKADNRYFSISYLDKVSREKTNDDGLYDLGRCKIGATVSVFEKVRGQKAYIHNFIVGQDNKYLVIFPYITDATINVVDQNGNAVPGALVRIGHNGVEEALPAKTGVINVEELEAGKEITISENNKPENTQTHILERDANKFVLEIYIPKFSTGVIKVIDEEGTLQSNYPVNVEYEDTQLEYNTAARRLIELNKLEVNKEIKIIDKNNPAIFRNYTIGEDVNEFTLTITKQIPKMVKVRLVDHKNRPLVGIPIEFTSNGVMYKETTDADGICRMTYERFVDKQKVYAQIFFPKKGKKK